MLNQRGGAQASALREIEQSVSREIWRSMDIVLIILGILGLGAIVISAYVFAAAARKYVSHNHDENTKTYAPPSKAHFIQRRPTDRRSNKPIAFPLTVNSVVIQQDRRHQPDRRLAA